MAVVALALTMLLTNCSTGPPGDGVDRPVSHALAAPQATGLGRIVETHTPDTPAGSGFATLPDGEDAFAALRELIAASERTLDLQYYIWRADRSGRLLMADLLDAADRGVRVRVLLDGLTPSWTDDELLALSAHDNLAIRLFNPTLSRHTPVLDILFHPARVTSRMHNKAFIVDNAVAVIGGRNISDRYFAAAASNYRDLDLLAAGDIVREISSSFDAFWNSRWSVPVAAVPRPRETTVDPTVLASQLRMRGRPAAAARGPPAVRRHVEERIARLTWAADAVLAADAPDKPETSSRRLVHEARSALIGDPRRDLLIETAYFVPTRHGVDALCGLTDRGIRVRVLTNSLASTDALTPFAGYRRYRPSLLGCGVELYEMRADARTGEGTGLTSASGSGVNLHSKAAVIDDRQVFVGSFNADPRSVNLNTEIALLIDSPALARDVTAFIEEGTAPDNAYRLALDDGRIVWREAREDRTVTLRREPGWTPWRGFWSRLVSMLPVIDQL